MAAFVAKAVLAGVGERVALAAEKTMYGGVKIAAGDEVFLFADEARGGQGLVGRCLVERVARLPKEAGKVPRVDVDLLVVARAQAAVGAG